jgi:hypothetical protein
VAGRLVDDYLDCRTEDGTRLGDGGEARGTRELRAHWDGIWKAVSRMAFVTQIGAIEVDGDHAGRSYCEASKHSSLGPLCVTRADIYRRSGP